MQSHPAPFSFSVCSGWEDFVVVTNCCQGSREDFVVVTNCRQGSREDFVVVTNCCQGSREDFVVVTNCCRGSWEDFVVTTMNNLQKYLWFCHQNHSQRQEFCDRNCEPHAFWEDEHWHQDESRNKEYQTSKQHEYSCTNVLLDSLVIAYD